LLVFRFDDNFAMMTPSEFVRDILIGKLGVAKIVIGPDFRFGRARAGDTGVLREMGMEYGFEVEVFPFVIMDGARVSSSRIRSLYASGETDIIPCLLGETGPGG